MNTKLIIGLITYICFVSLLFNIPLGTNYKVFIFVLLGIILCTVLIGIGNDEERKRLCLIEERLDQVQDDVDGLI